MTTRINLSIPTSFKLGTKVISVVFDNEYCNAEKMYGEADFTEKQITLCDEYLGQKLSKAEILKTFYHELAHMLLDSCGKHQLKYNEDFVDELGHKIYQFLKTSKYSP